MATKVAEAAPEEPAVEKAELLTVEAHPTIGRIERWRLSDGSVKAITLRQEYVETK